jgi:cell wall-associated NlpC family hydrolase
MSVRERFSETRFVAHQPMSFVPRPLAALMAAVFFSASVLQAQFKFEPQSNPARMEVKSSTGQWLATFTKDCQTVTLLGPKRTFAESTATDAVTHEVWVRTLPKPFDGEKVPQEWLMEALKANHVKAPDILAMGMQYLRDAPVIKQGETQIAGDASYGPPTASGSRAEGSDFNDYLGITVNAGGRADTPEGDQFRCVDCSGFTRLLFGYRLCAPNKEAVFALVAGDSQKAGELPRRAVQLAECGTGVVIVPNEGKQVTAFQMMQPGDLVFFDGDDNDGTAIDHVGTYLGLDAGGHHRFISSRKSADGPTMGDTQGKSILNGTGKYATCFRAVRRL